MTLSDWAEASRKRFDELPPTEAARISGRELADGALRRALQSYTSRFGERHFGPPIWEYDWDVVILLDTCRADALNAVAHEYDWLPNNVPSRKTASSWSRGWMQETFREEYSQEMAQTGHISWNGFTGFECDPDDWAILDEVWRDVWCDDLGCLPPEYVTDRALEAIHTNEADSWIVHYQQPHAPHRKLVDEVDLLTHDMVGKIGTSRTTVWDLLRSGDLSQERVWQAYLDNLRWALDDLATLLAELPEDLQVMVSADHGDLFGELGLYGHPRDIYHPDVATVPWATVDQSAVSAAEIRLDEPDYDIEAPDANTTAETRLKQLGYVE